MSVASICILLALLCFVLDAAGVTSRVGLQSLGLALAALAWFVG